MRTSSLICLVTAVCLSPACGQPPIDEGLRLPPGTPLTLERLKGPPVTGTLSSTDADTIVIREMAGALTRVRREEVAAIRAQLTAGPVATRAEPAGRSTPPADTASKAASSREDAVAYRDYRVPAGTLLPIELRSTVASDVSHAQDPVRARLRQAIRVEGVELVPAGATVYGVVTAAARATRDNERSRVALRFNVIEHPETGSRVSVRTVEVAFVADAAPAKRGKPPNPASEVHIESGADVSASLLEPFTVRIPRRG
jgi:hypothetical protein